MCILNGNITLMTKVISLQTVYIRTIHCQMIARVSTTPGNLLEFEMASGNTGNLMEFN